jgi:hypothetical protein
MIIYLVFLLIFFLNSCSSSCSSKKNELKFEIIKPRSTLPANNVNNTVNEKEVHSINSKHPKPELVQPAEEIHSIKSKCPKPELVQPALEDVFINAAIYPKNLLINDGINSVFKAVYKLDDKSFFLGNFIAVDNLSSLSNKHSKILSLESGKDFNMSLYKHKMIIDNVEIVCNYAVFNGDKELLGNIDLIAVNNIDNYRYDISEDLSKNKTEKIQAILENYGISNISDPLRKEIFLEALRKKNYNVVKILANHAPLSLKDAVELGNKKYAKAMLTGDVKKRWSSQDIEEAFTVAQNKNNSKIIDLLFPYSNMSKLFIKNDLVDNSVNFLRNKFPDKLPNKKYWDDRYVINLFDEKYISYIIYNNDQYKTVKIDKYSQSLGDYESRLVGQENILKGPPIRDLGYTLYLPKKPEETRALILNFYAGNNKFDPRLSFFDSGNSTTSNLIKNVGLIENTTKLLLANNIAVMYLNTLDSLENDRSQNIMDSDLYSRIISSITDAAKNIRNDNNLRSNLKLPKDIKIYGLGHSFGGTTAIRIVEKEPGALDGVIAFNPGLMPWGFNRYPSQERKKNDFIAPYRHISSIKDNILLIQNYNDNRVKASGTIEFLNRVKLEYPNIYKLFDLLFFEEGNSLSDTLDLKEKKLFIGHFSAGSFQHYARNMKYNTRRVNAIIKFINKTSKEKVLFHDAINDLRLRIFELNFAKNSLDEKAEKRFLSVAWTLYKNSLRLRGYKQDQKERKAAKIPFIAKWCEPTKLGEAECLDFASQLIASGKDRRPLLIKHNKSKKLSIADIIKNANRSWSIIYTPMLAKFITDESVLLNYSLRPFYDYVNSFYSNRVINFFTSDVTIYKKVSNEVENRYSINKQHPIDFEAIKFITDRLINKNFGNVDIKEWPLYLNSVVDKSSSFLPDFARHRPISYEEAYYWLTKKQDGQNLSEKLKNKLIDFLNQTNNEYKNLLLK